MAQQQKSDPTLLTSILSNATTSEEISQNQAQVTKEADSSQVGSVTEIGPDGRQRQEGSVGTAGAINADGDMSNNGGLGDVTEGST
ncbi:MAG: hypothetical protein NVS2B7_28900 [Herpetosiphon sp.]